MTVWSCLGDLIAMLCTIKPANIKIYVLKGHFVNYISLYLLLYSLTRARPVIHLKKTFTVTPEVIDPNDCDSWYVFEKIIKYVKQTILKV